MASLSSSPPEKVNARRRGGGEASRASSKGSPCARRRHRGKLGSQIRRLWWNHREGWSRTKIIPDRKAPQEHPAAIQRNDGAFCLPRARKIGEIKIKSTIIPRPKYYSLNPKYIFLRNYEEIQGAFALYRGSSQPPHTQKGKVKMP